jgi:site-specific DNA recombinase
MKPEAEWIRITVPAILDTPEDRDMFERAQIQLKKNYAVSIRNKKNEYLLGGKIRCTCGYTRTGEGPAHGKYLYYRCSSRVMKFPLQSECPARNKGVNARIADGATWKKISELMSSEELLIEQLKKWVANKQSSSLPSLHNAQKKEMQKKIADTYKQIERFTEAYSQGVYTIEKLKEYVAPLKDKILEAEQQMVKVSLLPVEGKNTLPVTEEDIQNFAKKSVFLLQGGELSFDLKRAILLSTIEKVIGTQESLTVYGYLPILNHVEFKSNHWNRRATKRWQINTV